MPRGVARKNHGAFSNMLVSSMLALSSSHLFFVSFFVSMGRLPGQVFCGFVQAAAQLARKADCTTNYECSYHSDKSL